MQVSETQRALLLPIDPDGSAETLRASLSARFGAKLGDTVRIMETRPLAKTVSWRVVEIIERAK